MTQAGELAVNGDVLSQEWLKSPPKHEILHSIFFFLLASGQLVEEDISNSLHRI